MGRKEVGSKEQERGTRSSGEKKEFKWNADHKDCSCRKEGKPRLGPKRGETAIKNNVAKLELD